MEGQNPLCHKIHHVVVSPGLVMEPDFYTFVKKPIEQNSK